jgi:prepilin-type N-terminal cleavage/methylation domain-containing protein/prepilin-type processing-associated H-X9-DG protein
MKFSSPRRAFTLIELLVVVSIIALLAAILFPVFGRARENARRSACQSNFKQIGLGILQYAQDYDETFPIQDTPLGSEANGLTYFADPSGPGWAINWHWAIYPYIKNWQVFTCPSATAIDTGSSAAAPFTAYAPNPAYPNSRNSQVVNGIAMGRKISVIHDTSAIVWIQEKQTLANASFVRPYREWAGSYTGKYVDWQRVFLANNHFEGGNLLFCDGHVKWRKQTQVCAHDFGLNDASVSGGKACGPNSFGATATAMF